MKKFYLSLQMVVCICLIVPTIVKSQCALLDATYTSYESRCTATGAIKVNATGGSGNYKYKTTGPVNTNFTTSDSITGLSAGVYSLIVNDLVTNCTVTITNVIIAGSYQDPRFTLTKIDVSCNNASNGSITVDSYSFGRGPFAFSIIAPSPMGVGTSNSSGIFNNLMAGNYSIRLTDSCGGIQTRQIVIVNYTWWIDAYAFTKTGCDEATGYIKVVDSRGNISTVGGIPGFTYGIVRSPGDTLWSASPNFTFALLGNTVFQVIAKDNCGIIKRAVANISLIPTVSATVSTYDYTCNFFSASLAAGANFLTADFCLYNSGNVQLSCNNSGVFTGLLYGAYCIKAHDACTDTTISRCFVINAPPVSIANTILISAKICISFTAAVTGQVGLTNPEYCLFDTANVLIGCNYTGIFPGLPYQPYCISTHDGCRDTTINRCFNPAPPMPVFPAVINPNYITCNNFGIQVGGDSLTAPVFCLYDSNGGLISCNSTGVFDSIPLGNYCVTIHDDCYDTTVTRCLSVLVPVIQNDMVVVAGNKTCLGFTLTVTSNNLNNPQYCLYNAGDVLIACNETGVFNSVPYGSYCVKSDVICPDTTLVTCISVYPNLPEVDGAVQTSNTTCIDFTAEITRQQNLSNPQYCLYNALNVLLSCNSRGIFENLTYGSYCIKITDGCYDTSILRCFTKAPTRVTLSGTAGKSCSFGWAQFNLAMGNGGGYLPVNIKIYYPDGSLCSQATYNTNAVFVDSIPGSAPGQNYKIVATDNCGNKDSLSIGSPASYFTHTASVVPKCPGAIWPNGSGDIQITARTNLGSLSVKIIKKNGMPLFPTISANTVVAGIYSFIDLGPGTYILGSIENYCGKKLYDTVVIRNYQYPNLDRSSAYQCDVNGFSVSAIAANGVGPFSYEIIGSQPTTPDITTAPQSSPLFTINNGSNYSLIRLRALDACGNATLGDASILPLAINGIISSQDCLSQPTTLSVDSFFNSSYSWYKKVDEYSTDSILIGNGTSYFIPAVQPSDTGIYVCHVSVNSGCINRTFIFHLGGQCWIVLPVKLQDFKGREMGDKNLLTWATAGEQDLDQFIIERKNNAGNFELIGNVLSAGNSSTKLQYRFVDEAPQTGRNAYRLALKKNDLSFSYSNTVLLNNNKTSSTFTVYPNPVTDKFFIESAANSNHNYSIRLLNSMNQSIKEITILPNLNGRFKITRPIGIPKGVYILCIFDENDKQTFKQKMIFL
ncbi:MAG: T9SS type A sorting domain-containing protein [Ferruginibacter sp.]|nr:T9SS type A sorting domain-containing protein [Ferruginibacter sp.]